MRAVPFPGVTAVYHLKDGTEENDLHVQQGHHAGADGLVEAGDPTYHLAYTRTVWTPDELERSELATGRNIELVILGAGGIPPLRIGVTEDGPEDQDPIAPGVWLVLRGDLLDDVRHVLMLLVERGEQAASDGTLAEVDRERLTRLSELSVNLERHAAELARHLAEQAEPELRDVEAEIKQGIAEAIAEGHVDPWIGEGADGCRRSARIAEDELDSMDADDERRPRLEAARDAWLDRARTLDEEPSA